MPRSCASLLTAVGLQRVSIGPPIKVMDAGIATSSRASIRAVAAISGPKADRRQPHARDLWRRGVQELQHLDDIVDIVVEAKVAEFARHHARVRPVGDVDIAIGRKASTVPRSSVA